MSEAPKETGTLIERRPNSNYTSAEVTEGLTVLALCAGNSRRAERELEARGRRIPYKTLQAWKARIYATEYEDLCEREIPRQYAEIAQRCKDVALEASEVEMILLDRMRTEAQEIPARELAGAVRNVSTTKGINLTQAGAADQRPTVIREVHDLAATVRALGKWMPELKDNPLAQAIDSTAVEVDTPDPAPASPASSPPRATQTQP